MTTEPLSTEPTPMRHSTKGVTLFGYRHVSGIPLCPCRDPGNYVACEQGTDRLSFLLRCWCGRTCEGTWDDEKERAEFLAANSGPVHG